MQFKDKVIRILLWVAVFIILLVYPLILIVAYAGSVLRYIQRRRKDISGEVALITGGGGGLGKEIAIRLAREGCHIAVADINEQAAKSTSELLTKLYNIKAKPFKVDVSKFDEVKALSKDIEEQLGPVTILINNAGLLTLSSSDNPPPEDSQKMIDTNLMSNIWTVRVFLEKMKQLRKGHIVSICSIAGLIPCPRQMEYSASKFGVHGFMDALSTELFALDCEFIKTTTVFPYFLNTNQMVNQLLARSGLELFGPSVTGAETADAIVEGLINDKVEVLIPGFCAIICRLFGLLPKWCQLQVIPRYIGRDVLMNLSY